MPFSIVANGRFREGVDHIVVNMPLCFIHSLRAARISRLVTTADRV
jgi:hypothetical protein